MLCGLTLYTIHVAYPGAERSLVDVPFTRQGEPPQIAAQATLPHEVADAAWAVDENRDVLAHRARLYCVNTHTKYVYKMMHKWRRHTLGPNDHEVLVNSYTCTCAINQRNIPLSQITIRNHKRSVLFSIFDKPTHHTTPITRSCVSLTSADDRGGAIERVGLEFFERI